MNRSIESTWSKKKNDFKRFKPEARVKAARSKPFFTLSFPNKFRRTKSIQDGRSFQFFSFSICFERIRLNVHVFVHTATLLHFKIRFWSITFRWHYNSSATGAAASTFYFVFFFFFVSSWSCHFEKTLLPDFLLVGNLPFIRWQLFVFWNDSAKTGKSNAPSVRPKKANTEVWMDQTEVRQWLCHDCVNDLAKRMDQWPLPILSRSLHLLSWSNHAQSIIHSFGTTSCHNSRTQRKHTLQSNQWWSCRPASASIFTIFEWSLAFDSSSV